MKRSGRKSAAQTPALAKERIKGSSTNPAKSAASKKSGASIKFTKSILNTLSEKAKEYNEKHPNNKVSVSTLKAVMRRGMGAFSTSHRPGMTRQGWGYARVNKFLLKRGGGKVKAAYVQDDDLMARGGALDQVQIIETKENGRVVEVDFKIGKKADANMWLTDIQDVLDYYPDKIRGRKSAALALKERFLKKNKIKDVKQKAWNLNSIEVEPKYRGKGLASLLLKAIIKYCKKKKIDTLFLYRMPYDVWDESLDAKELKKFYERYGFVEIASGTMYKKMQDDDLMARGGILDYFIHWTNRDGLENILVEGVLYEETSLTNSLSLPFDIENNMPFGIRFKNSIKSELEKVGDVVGVTELEQEFEYRTKSDVDLEQYFDGFVVRNNTNKNRLEKFLDNSNAFWNSYQFPKYYKSHNGYNILVSVNKYEDDDLMAKGGKLDDGSENFGHPPVSLVDIPLIHETSSENAYSIIKNGFKKPTNKIATLGIYVVPLPYKSNKWNKNYVELDITLIEGSKIFWTNTQSPSDFYYGGGNIFYQRLYKQLNKGFKRPDEDYSDKNLQSNYLRRLENWLQENGYCGVQQGGEIVITNLNCISSIDYFDRYEKGGETYHLGGDMSKHLAPNGKPSNLTHEQWHLVRTPEFKAWFGDWENDPENASKVVDENGEPLVVYHGTTNNFNVFSKSSIGKNDYGYFGVGFYFGDINAAEAYSQTSLWNQIHNNVNPNGRVLSCFLNIRNPLIDSSENLMQSKDTSTDFTKNVTKNYDGIISIPYQRFSPNTEYVAFESNQIKLADGSNTTFDPKNPDIRYENGGGISSPNIEFMKWYVDWYKSANKDVHVSISIPNEFSSPVKDNDGKIVILDVIEKKGDADAKKYMNEILGKADELGVSIYLQPIPRTQNLKSEEHKKKITKDYLTKYYEKFGFKNTNGGFMVREPKMASHGMMNKGGEIDQMIKDGIVELKMYDTTKEHSKLYGFDAQKPLYIHSLVVEKEHRLNGIGSKVMQYIIDYAERNGNDVIFGHITQKAEPSIDVIKSMLRKSGFNTIEGNNDFYKIMKEEMIQEEVYAEGGATYHLGGDMSKHLAPNGRKSNLTHEQWHLVRTPEFKAWFGDWENDPENASKVVDENGEPLVVYHGTDKFFNEFKIADVFRKDWGVRDYGAYFSSSILTAKEYSLEKIEENQEYLEWQNKLDELKTNQEWENWMKLYEYGKDKYKPNKPVIRKSVRVIECFLNLRNPFLIDGKGKHWFSVLKGLINDEILNSNDGMIVSNIIEVFNDIQDTYIAFHPNQIKLADGSNTTFDPKNPDIRYEEGGQVTDTNYFDSTKCTFSPVEPDDAKEILDEYLVWRRKRKKPEYIETNSFGKLKVDYASEKKNAFWQTRSLSYYFITENNDAVIRISDHWSKSNYDKSRKLNCSNIRSCFWENYGNKFIYRMPGQKYQSDLIAGICKFEDFQKRYEEGGQITDENGYLKYSINDGELVIDNIKVYKQRVGTGRKLLNEAKSLARSKNLKISLYSYPQDETISEGELKQFYLSQGFELDPDDVDGRLFRYDKGGNLPIGKLAKGMSLGEVAQHHGFKESDLTAEFSMGIETEKEHTDDVEIAKAIALDHLYEDPKYYTKLKRVEGMDNHLKKISKKNMRKYDSGGGVDANLSNDPIFKFKTPTGEPSKLPYLQQVLVRTRGFKEFFGDWEVAAANFLSDGRENFERHYKDVSKVLDYVTLEPRMVYHGTMVEKEFFDFDVTQDRNQGRPYGYFAHNKEYSDNFTRFSQANDPNAQPFLYRCFLNVRNPFYAVGDHFFERNEADEWKDIIFNRIAFDKYGNVNNKEQVERLNDVLNSQIGSYITTTFANPYSFWLLMARDINKDFKYFLLTYKYDGIFYGEEIRDNYDRNDPAQFTEAVCIFRANQVKLADGRNLNFDPLTTDIRYEEGGSVSDSDIEIPQQMDKKTMLHNTILSKKKFAEGGHISYKNGKTNDAKKGGYFEGRSHAEGGIKAINVDTGQLLEVEGDEVIITKNAVSDPQKRMFEGKMMTNREILSKINQMGGGVSFAEGGKTEISHCGCSGKKYNFGGEVISDFDIFTMLSNPQKIMEFDRKYAKSYVDDLLQKMK